MIGIPDAGATKSEAQRRAADDATLALAVGRHDEQAPAELYRRHVGPCLGLDRRVLSDRTLAEEVVQAVFVRMWRDPSRFDATRGSMRAFLLAQTVRSALATLSDGEREAIGAANEPGAKQVPLQSDSGATLARLVLLPDGSGYLRGDHLEPLPPNKTYQLWAVTGPTKDPTVVSAGVLGPEPSALGFRASGPVHAFAMTVEDVPGVVTSQQKAIAQGAVA